MTNSTNVAIVTYFDQQDRYVMGGERQKQSLEAVGFPMEHYYQFRSCADLGCPEHSDIPYAFKPAAIAKVRDMGYDIVIWMDSPVYAIKPLDRLIEHIYLGEMAFFDNIGFTVGDYTSDDCLVRCNTTREQAFQIPMIMACVMGFNFNSIRAQEMFRLYANGTDGYVGAWTNDNGQVSDDKRVKGHRHDQSVMSLILDAHGIKPLHPHSTFFAYFGNPGHMPHAETVCLLSQGY